MAVLWNPTNEKFETMFEGIPCVIYGVCEDHPKGHKIRTDNKARVNHLINVYGKRGLTSLEYGDDVSGMEEKKKIAAIKANRKFREKQVIAINTDNERRKQQGQSYIDPTKQVVKYAAELGLELISPYAVKTDESKRVAGLEEENKDLRKQMGAMMDKMSLMLEKMTDGGGKEESVTEIKEQTDEEVALTKLKNSFFKLSGPKFKTWLEGNADKVVVWPNDLQLVVREKWLKNFPEEKYPLDTTV